MSCQLCESQQLLERLTFDQLFSVSEPKRVLRSKTVRGPPLDVEAMKDGVFYHFNFKSFPSTTGKRQKGYIKFFKPKKKIPLEKVECLVDCTCPDFRYRWAWANKQRGSSVVGAKSMNQAFNRAPRVTNPRGRPGLCKHLLALRDFIYGEFENFDGSQGGTPERLDAVVQSVQAKGKTAPAPKKPTAKKVEKPAAKPTEPPKERPAVVRPVKSQPATQKNQVPDEFSTQTQRRFNKVEGVVVNHVNELSQIIQEADDVKVDPESSEALQLLRDIRDGIRILAAKEQEEPVKEPAPEEAEGPSPEDLPEPEPETAEQ